ncbi:hypothetical protein [Limnochorda pilosa]|nr:hypothetical protein [Limnochorda pilosa]
MRTTRKVMAPMVSALLLASAALAWAPPAGAEVQWGGKVESVVTAMLTEAGGTWQLGDPVPAQQVTLRVEVPSASGDAYARAEGTGLLAWPVGEESLQPDLTFRLDEAYVGLYTDRADYRVGLQQVKWGSAYRVNPTSFVPRPNPADPLAEPPAVWAARATGYWGDTSLDAVWLPLADVVPKEQVPALLLTNPIGGAPMELVTPETGWDQGELALSLTRRALGPVDLSVSYFLGKEDLPRLADPPSDATTYDDVQRFGIDLSGSLGDAGVWAEAAYGKPATRPGVNVDAVAGVDYQTRGGTYLAGQLLYTLDTQAIESQGGTASVDDGRLYLMAVVEAEVAHAVTADLAAAYGPESGAVYGLASLRREVAPGTHLELSASTALAGGGDDPLLDAPPGTVRASLRMEF